jgi:uncharacterized membrane protein YqjE
MDSDDPQSFSISSAAGSFRGWIAALLLYIELRLRLCAVEAKEAGTHLLILALLLLTAMVFFGGFLVMLLVFLLYLIMLIFHWEWGWSALACAGVLFVTSIIAGVILRFQIIKPLFQTTFAEFQKDREWLAHSPTKTR